MPERRTFSVALVGTKFMGRAHSNAWRQAPRFFDLPAEIRMTVLVGRDAPATKKAAAKLGWERAETDWRKVVTDPSIDIVDICTPNDSHAEIAIAAARAGKAILCEKPLARDLTEARRAAGAVERAGVTNLVCFNYRRAPAIMLARQMIEAGALGSRIYHFRARYAQDWITSEKFPLVWRLQAKHAGSGALGDLGAHVLDLARFLVGEIGSISAVSETFVKRRPRVTQSAGSRLREKRAGSVDVDDAVNAIGRFRGGALLNVEATRFAQGRKNALSLEINGGTASLRWNLEEMNRLLFYSANDPPSRRGFREIIVTEQSHPYLVSWWPPGHLLGYEHTFIHTVADFVTALADRKPIQPDFADALKTQRLLDAIQRSARMGRSISLHR